MSGIRPAFALHEIHVAAAMMNSPQEPCVALWSSDLAGHSHGGRDNLSPAQARELARLLLEAAETAGRN